MSRLFLCLQNQKATRRGGAWLFVRLASQLGSSDLFLKRMKARRKGAKKRSLHVVNEHFERYSNAASAALRINQSFLNW